MKLMFLPVTLIGNVAHALVYYDFSQRKNRYFLSAYARNVSDENNWKQSVVELISSSDFLREFNRELNEENRSMIYSTANLLVCALFVDPKSSVLYKNEKFIHQWISIRDLINGWITCDYALQTKDLRKIFKEITQWLNSKSVRLTNTMPVDRQSFKIQVRQFVWDLMELKNEIYFPRPCHNRIPNFRQCHYASEIVTSLNCFHRANIIKINPSLAQESLRYLTLAFNKILLTPSPALETVFFYKLDPKTLHRNQFEYAASKRGTAQLGVPLELSDFKQLHIDIVVVASVAVNPLTGARIGKGKGYGDLEYGILSELGCVSKTTMILTTCHESQLINDLPSEIMDEHDLPVDIIVTPKRYIYTNCLFARPKRVYWEKISSAMISSIPILRQLNKNL